MEHLKEYDFHILRPGGNDTCLIAGIVLDPVIRKRVNDEIMQNYPFVEQVGFVDLNLEHPELVMAGGEFCGNATRSAAWLCLSGKPGEIEMKVSGVKNKLKAGVILEGSAWSQMPVYPDLSKIISDPENPENFIVEMEGIAHCVVFKDDSVQELDENLLKKISFEKIKRLQLDKMPAAGVIYVNRRQDDWSITPIVYVGNIETLFYESACGSGVTAIGLVLSKLRNQSIDCMSIIQPSGLPISVTVKLDSYGFKYAQIEGPIEMVQSGKIRLFNF